MCADSENGTYHVSSTASPPIVIISITIAILGAIGILLGVLVALFFRYEQHIRVWLYAHNLLLWWVTEEELDKDKEYDVVLSFSHEDEEFVVHELWPKLEANGLKVCMHVHVREWLAGDAIVAQIERSVESSRRTVIVLSPNFLRSEWSLQVFRSAHMKAMSEGRMRVIIILYQDIPNFEELDEELKVYLTTNTYVEWGSKYFWDNLFYALPHRPLPTNLQQVTLN